MICSSCSSYLTSSGQCTGCGMSHAIAPVKEPVPVPQPEAPAALPAEVVARSAPPVEAPISMIASDMFAEHAGFERALRQLVTLMTLDDDMKAVAVKISSALSNACGVKCRHCGHLVDGE